MVAQLMAGIICDPAQRPEGGKSKWHVSALLNVWLFDNVNKVIFATKIGKEIGNLHAH